MEINILPAGPEDAAEMISVGMKAFANDVLAKSTFDVQSGTPEEVEEYTQWRVSLARLRMSGQGKHYFKARDEATGAIVGYAGLNGPGAEILPHTAVPRPKFLNSDVDDELMQKMNSTRERFLGDRKDVWYVQSMLVHPDYQGRGIAKRLLNHAMAGADRDGQDVYLEGTAAGQPLYLRCGFEPLEDISIMNGACVIKAMIRHPQAPKENGQ